MKKLSQASEGEKIKALAELDGWKDVRKRPHHPIKEARDMITGVMPDGCIRVCGRYLNDYNAIIPLIQKQCKDLSVRVDFLNALRSIVGNAVSANNICSDYDMITATPLQLSDALLVATGKFEP